MAYSITIHAEDNASSMLAAIQAGLTVESLRKPVGAAVVLLFQKHFLALPPNKMGWASSGFWAKCARATNWTPSADGVDVNVDELGARQRLLGGEIHPTAGHKYLTIPARAEAYGKRAGEFDDLHVAFGRNGPYALVQNISQLVSFGRKRKDGSRTLTPGDEIGGLVMFWLVKSVHQDADPDVIPSDEEIIDTAMATIASAVSRFLDRRAN